MAEKKKFAQPDVDSNTVAELSRKLIEANNQLVISERKRKGMLENISHDLRAPLTAIRSTVDYLKSRTEGDAFDVSPEEMSSMLNLLDVRTRTLEVLIQDLYYLTCLDGDKEEFSFEEVPLTQLLEEYFFAAEIDDKYEGYQLDLRVANDLDAVVKMDVAKMSRVLDNLFTNARKYAGEGSRIELGAYVNDDKAYFYVADNGRGIPEKSLPYIFDRTYRVSDSRTPGQQTGSGLGLSIARAIVEKHEGSICCESTEGKGSRFTVMLPIVK